MLLRKTTSSDQSSASLICTCTTRAPAPGPLCRISRPSNTMFRPPKREIAVPLFCSTAR